MSRALARVGCDVPAEFPSAGQRAFAATEGKQLWIAMQLGITVGAVSRLQGGHRRPCLDLALAIEGRFGIPVAQWRVDSSATSEGCAATGPGAGSEP